MKPARLGLHTEYETYPLVHFTPPCAIERAPTSWSSPWSTSGCETRSSVRARAIRRWCWPLPDALTQEIDTAVPQPPANDLVPLVVAIGTGIILLAGMAGGWRPLLRMIGRDRPLQTKAAAAKLRIVAVADPSPAVETTAADFPALVLTVGPATECQTVLEFDDELEALAS